MNYKFVLLDPSTGSEKMHWVLPPPVIVGRGTEADVSIGDPSISRRHCQFLTDPEGALVVRDLGSTNGIYVDNQRVQKALLIPGGLVTLGAIVLRVDWTEDEVTDSPAFGDPCDVKITQPMKTVYLSREDPFDITGDEN